MEPIKQLPILTWRMSDGNVVKIEQHDELESTVVLARAYAQAGYPDRYAVFCVRRPVPLPHGRLPRQGKARRRTESGVYLTLLLRPSVFASQAGFLRLLSGISLLGTLEEHTSRKIGIGWVSDIYCDTERIGDTTVEGKLDAYASFEYLLVTFSVRLDEKRFPPRLTDMILKVFEGEDLSLSALIARSILNRFFSLYAALKTPQKFMDVYRAHFVLHGAHAVFFDAGGKPRSCKVLGVDTKDGTLMVETRDGSITKISNRASILLPRRIPRRLLR